MVTAADVVAVIPARGGSKSIPRKNVRHLSGHPLIAYAIAAAQEATTVDRIIVSSDDEQILETARVYGADTPFVRPGELARDDTPDFPVFQHCLRWLENNEGSKPAVFVQIRPTSPLRPPGLVDRAVEILLADPTASSVRSVTPPGQNPYKMWTVSSGILHPLLESEQAEPYNMPRQELPATFWQTGHVDAIRSSTVESGSITGQRILPVHVDSKYAIDIDTEDQWQLAELLVKRQGCDFVHPIMQPVLKRFRVVAFDFDGVFTDNRVRVSQDGAEAVVCNRADGLGISNLKAAGVRTVVLSSERNPVVSARCKKLEIDCYQGLEDKAAALLEVARRAQVGVHEVVFVGNDTNDVECLRLAGLGVAVADAHPEALDAADWVLNRRGGEGAVRELCDHLLERRSS